MVRDITEGEDTVDASLHTSFRPCKDIALTAVMCQVLELSSTSFGSHCIEFGSWLLVTPTSLIGQAKHSLQTLQSSQTVYVIIQRTTVRL